MKSKYRRNKRYKRFQQKQRKKCRPKNYVICLGKCRKDECPNDYNDYYSLKHEMESDIEIWPKETLQSEVIVFLLNHYLHKKKIEPKKIQQCPTGYMWNLSRGKTKI